MKKEIAQSNPASSECDFSYEWYEKMLAALCDSGYTFSSFVEDGDEELKRVYLRHDVDLDPDKALPIAKIEHDLDIQATYFIRISNPYYNPFDLASLVAITEICSLKHSIALHFDGLEREEEPDFQILEQGIERQHTALNAYFPVERIVSFHHAPIAIQNRQLSNFTSTYEPRFYSQISYLSDSKSVWKDGDPLQWLKNSPAQNLQLLCHPIWWGKRDPDTNRHLQNWLKGKCLSLDKDLGNDFKPYKRKLFDVCDLSQC